MVVRRCSTLVPLRQVVISPARRSTAVCRLTLDCSGSHGGALPRER
jgi:hypothetical protein